MAENEEHDDGTETAESERSKKLSEEVPEEASGEGATPLGDTGEHSDAPGPHGTGEVYPRGDRPEKDED